MGEFINPMESEFKILYSIWDRVDKTDWAPGDYQSEPDHIKLLHKRTNYICYIRRAAIPGSLCGYVEVKRDHAMYNRDYMSSPPGDCAHGGCTFSDHLSPIRKRKKRWVYGFDCAHARDSMPGLDYIINKTEEQIGVRLHGPSLGFMGQKNTYKNVHYVMRTIDEMSIWMDRVDDTARWAYRNICN